jgi:hypothetical protein
MIVLWASNHLFVTHCLPLTVMLYNILSIISRFFFVCNNNHEFYRTRPDHANTRALHRRLISSYTSDFSASFQMAESQMVETLELQNMSDRPPRRRHLLPRLTLMTLTEPSLPGRWPRSLCLSHPLCFQVWQLTSRTSCARLLRSRWVVRDIAQALDIHDGGAPNAPNTIGSLPGVPIRYPIVCGVPRGVGECTHALRYFLRPY